MLDTIRPQVESNTQSVEGLETVHAQMDDMERDVLNPKISMNEGINLEGTEATPKNIETQNKGQDEVAQKAYIDEKTVVEKVPEKGQVVDTEARVVESHSQASVQEVGNAYHLAENSYHLPDSATAKVYDDLSKAVEQARKFFSRN